MYKLNKSLLVSITATCILGLFSCSQEDYNEDIQTDETYYHFSAGNAPCTMSTSENSETDSIGTLRFSYKGDIYESKVLFTDDKAVILDEQIANLFENLKKKEDIAIFVNEDESFDFYNSYEEMNSCRKWKLKMSSTTRKSDDNFLYIKKFKIRLWKHAKGRKEGGPFCEWEIEPILTNSTLPPFLIGDEFRLETSTSYNPYISLSNLPQVYGYLKNYNMNNEISSFQMWATTAAISGPKPIMSVPQEEIKRVYQHITVTFYDNGDWTGRSLTFSEVSVNQTFWREDRLSKFGFNDLTSSIKITFDNNMN